MRKKNLLLNFKRIEKQKMVYNIIVKFEESMNQSPNHYKDTKLMDLLIERQVPFAEGNIMKYVYRWRDKGGIDDLYKARDYLTALIASEDLKQL